MSTQNVLFDAPGPKARVRHLVLTVIAAVILLAILWAVVRKFDSMGQLLPSLWKPFLTSEVWTSYLLPGIWATIKAAALSIVFAMIFGLVFGMGRLSEIRAVRWVSGVIVEFFRAVPVLLMMYFFFIWLAQKAFISADYYALVATVTALTLYNGAVIAELVRSGVFGLPKGQREAGLAVGLTRSQALRSIELPQALTAMLPALVSQLVVILKDSALGSALPYVELMTQVGNVGTAYGNVVPSYIVGAAIFITLNYIVTLIAGLISKRINRRGKTAGGAKTQAMPGAPMGTGVMPSTGLGGENVEKIDPTHTART